MTHETEDLLGRIDDVLGPDHSPTRDHTVGPDAMRSIPVGAPPTEQHRQVVVESVPCAQCQTRTPTTTLPDLRYLPDHDPVPPSPLAQAVAEARDRGETTVVTYAVYPDGTAQRVTLHLYEAPDPEAWLVDVVIPAGPVSP